MPRLLNPLAGAGIALLLNACASMTPAPIGLQAGQLITYPGRKETRCASPLP